MSQTTDITASGKNVGIIHCLTIPLYEEVVLLPNASIAEVVSYKEPATIDDAPEWFLGYVEWRDKRVPLISFEAVSGKEAKSAKKNSRIAVLNTLNGNSQLPYIGILSQGIPSLALVQEQGLEEQGDAGQNRPTVGAYVKLGGIKALIPNIDAIVQRLRRLNLM